MAKQKVNGGKRKIGVVSPIKITSQKYASKSDRSSSTGNLVGYMIWLESRG